MTTPSVGRIVHYVSHGSPVLADGSQMFAPECRAALVTEVEEPSVSESGQNRVGLMVANPTGLFFHSLSAGGCRYDEDRHGGTWHWPERV